VARTDLKPHTCRGHCSTSKLAGFVLAIALLTGAGCELFGPIFEAGRTNPAQYTLPEERTTAILVDDPQNLLTDSAMRGVIASRIKFDLEQNKVKTTVIDPSKVNMLESELMDAYATTPTDVIGRKLGADQVISVVIEEYMLRQSPGTFKPKLQARVKVIDVVEGKRLFPPLLADNPEDPTSARKGWLVNTTLRESAPLEQGRSEEAVMQKKMSERLGRDVARLFFKWADRQPGQPFDD
jgi:hypothetical protein